MICKKCGNYSDNNKFCVHCGYKNKKKINFILIGSLSCVLIIGIIIFIFVIFSNANNINNDINQNESADSPVEYIDADKYFEENAEIIAQYNAKESKFVTSEKETYELLLERGFDDYAITTIYNMDGEFLSDEIIDAESDETHPMYSTYYAPASDSIWLINVVNGSITASPVLYNQDSKDTVETMIVEDDILMAYDGPLNKFYEIIPYESFAKLKKVERIDADTLKNLSVEEIDKL